MRDLEGERKLGRAWKSLNKRELERERELEGDGHCPGERPDMTQPPLGQPSSNV